MLVPKDYFQEETENKNNCKNNKLYGILKGVNTMGKWKIRT